MKATILIISFLLEGIISNFVPINGFLAPLFTLVALIIIYPLFDEASEYYKYAFVTGLAYDLFYTDTILFHAIIFCFMAFIQSRSPAGSKSKNFGRIIGGKAEIRLIRDRIRGKRKKTDIGDTVYSKWKKPRKNPN